MKLFLSLLFIVAVVSAGSPSSINSDVKLSGDGGWIIKSNHEWNVGGDTVGFLGNTNVQGGQSRHSSITGPGSNTYTRNATLDASVSNSLDTATELEFDGGGIYEESVNLHDLRVAIPPIYSDANETDSGQTPSEQYVNTYASGMGDMAHYMGDQVVDGINLTTDYRAEGGSGFFEVGLETTTQAGSDPSSDTVDYRNRVKERYKSLGSSNGSFSESVSIKYRDMSHPLGFGDSVNSTSVISDLGNNF